MKQQWMLYITLFICTAFVFAWVAPYTTAAEPLERLSDPNTVEPEPNTGLISSPTPTRTLSLEACFDRADQDNRDLAVARRNLPIAQAGVKIAAAIPNPLAQVQLGFGPAFTELFTGQTQQAFFSEQLQTAGKRSKKIDVAQAFYGLTELQLEALRFDVHNRVRRAYAEQAAAEAYEELVEAQRKVAIELANIAKLRFKAGKIARAESLQADLNVMQFDTQRNQAKGRLEQATAALCLVIGERPKNVEVIDVDDNGLFKLSSKKTEIVPQPSMTLPPISQLLNQAKESRLDLNAAKQQVFLNRRALSLAKSQQIPNAFLGGGFTFSTFNPIQPVGFTPQPNWLGSGGFLGVSAENPIFYQHQGEVAQAIANLRNSERQIDLLEVQISSETVIAYNSVRVARENIFAFQKDLLPLATKVAKLARRAYQVGSTDLATAIIAQQQYQQTLSNYFDAVSAYQGAWADLEKAVGVPLKL